MWNLERLGLRNLSASARGAAAAALDATSLDQLEVLLEVDADWHPADGKWSVHEVQQSLAGEAGAAHLNTLRETAAAAVTTERSLAYLVQSPIASSLAPPGAKRRRDREEIPARKAEGRGAGVDGKCDPPAGFHGIHGVFKCCGRA